MESKSIECVQENGKLDSAIRVGLFRLRLCMKGEVIVSRPNSGSACIEEDELAAGAGTIGRPFAVLKVGACDRGRTVISLGSLWEPGYDEHETSRSEHNIPSCRVLTSELRRAISCKTLLWGISRPLNNTSTCSSSIESFVRYLMVAAHSAAVRFFRSSHLRKCLSYCDLLLRVSILLLVMQP